MSKKAMAVMLVVVASMTVREMARRQHVRPTIKVLHDGRGRQPLRDVRFQIGVYKEKANVIPWATETVKPGSTIGITPGAFYDVVSVRSLYKENEYSYIAPKGGVDDAWVGNGALLAKMGTVPVMVSLEVVEFDSQGRRRKRQPQSSAYELKIVPLQ